MTEHDLMTKGIAVDLINSFNDGKTNLIFRMMECLSQINMLEVVNDDLERQIKKNKQRIRDRWNDLDSLTTEYMEMD